MEKNTNIPHIGPTREITVEYTYDFEHELENIIAEISGYYPQFDRRLEDNIRRAYWFAFDAHAEQLRASGEPYFMHPVEATKILLSIKPDTETIIACLLHDVIEDTPITADEIGEKFGDKVKFLCQGVEKVSQVRMKKNEQTSHYDTIQKLFVAVAKDIRVIFIKLADRIHNLQTLHHVKPEKRYRIANESTKIYAPVAIQLGLNEFKTMIEDECLRHLHPAEYEKVSAELNRLEEMSKEFIEEGKEQIEKILKKKRISYVSVVGRVKNISSVYEKLKRKNLSSVNEIYDLIAFRILVKTNEMCYRALGALHSEWVPMPGRFKDYISVRKPNGYRSLHTTVLGIAESAVPTELQIRTVKMHMDAEYGPAAHWAYKHVGNSHFDQDYIKRTSWLPEDIMPFEDQENSEKFYEAIADSILSHRIYVFTPQGEVRNLPMDSTPVDFAYSVHSEVGDSCVGARVNGAIKPLDYKLQNGEIVEIITKLGRTPNPHWLEFVKSSHARTRIQSHINKIRREEGTLVEKVKTEPDKIEKELTDAVSSPAPKDNKYNLKGEILIGGEAGIAYRFGNCCTPLPGKNVIAYKSRGLEAVMHDADCDTLGNLDPSRFLEASFRIEKRIAIRAYDRVGLAKDYTTVISDQGMNILSFDSKYEKKDNKRIVTVTFSIYCGSEREMETLSKKLYGIRNVFDVKELSES